MKKLLHCGKMTSRELADWFGIKFTTLEADPNYYEKLKKYCDYERINNGIIVKDIYTYYYTPNGRKGKLFKYEES